MNKLKEIIRLKYASDLSVRQIARCVNLSVGVTAKYLKRAEAANVVWPLPDGLTDQALQAKLQPDKRTTKPPMFAPPDYAVVQQELKRKGMTRYLLWQEYAEANPHHHCSYPHFTVQFKRWRQVQQLSMRQLHRAGEKLFVDYCGPTLSVVNPDTGEVRSAQVFVAVLGASSYTYAEATWSQALPDWVGAHVRAFTFYGGVPELVIPDNLKSAVTRACRYDPDINPTYQQMARHYGTAILPARPYKPKDKSKAEVGVQVVERWIMMRLRKQTFYTLASLNQAIQVLLVDLNARPFKQLPGSRTSQFKQLDQPVLKPLPSSPYAYRHIKKARVHLDYHVEYERHYYSVPYQLVKQEVVIHAGEQTLEVHHNGQVIAVHPRVHHEGGHTTDSNHMAKAHRKHQEWSPQRFLQWAETLGPHTLSVIEYQLAGRRHPEHGYRACLGILSLAKKYGQVRLEAACHRATHIGGLHYRHIASILSNSMDRVPLPAQDSAQTDQPQLPLDHDHIRGAEYYH